MWRDHCSYFLIQKSFYANSRLYSTVAQWQFAILSICLYVYFLTFESNFDFLVLFKNVFSILANNLSILANNKKTSSYEQRCGFSTQFSFLYFFHFMDVICFDWIVPLNSHWFHLILNWILQFLKCGYRRVDGWMDKQMDRIMDRQTE